MQALSLLYGSLIAFFYLMVRAERNFNIDLQDVKLKKSFGPAEKSLIAEKLEAVLLYGSHAQRFFFFLLVSFHICYQMLMTVTKVLH